MQPMTLEWFEALLPSIRWSVIEGLDAQFDGLRNNLTDAEREQVRTTIHGCIRLLSEPGMARVQSLTAAFAERAGQLAGEMAQSSALASSVGVQPGKRPSSRQRVKMARMYRELGQPALRPELQTGLMTMARRSVDLVGPALAVMGICEERNVELSDVDVLLREATPPPSKSPIEAVRLYQPLVLALVGPSQS